MSQPVSKPQPRLSTGLLCGLALLTASGPLATDMYLPTLPEVSSDLHASSSLTQLTLSAFMLGMAVGQLFIGVLSDSYGRRLMLRAGVIVALIGVLGCALAPHISVLITGRLIHGLGAGACVVVARAIIPDLAEGKAIAQAFTLLMMIQGLAPVVAPVAGGLLADSIGWRGIFWVLSAICILQTLVAFRLPETLPKERRSAADVRALAHTFGAVLKNQGFRYYTVALSFGFAGLFAYVSASSFVIQEQWGFSSRQYSLVFATNALGLLAFGALNNRLLKKVDSQVLARLAFTLMLIGALATMIWARMDVPVAFHLLALFLAAAPVSMALGNTSGLAADLVRKQAGSGSAVMGFFQFVLAALVSPLVGIGTNEAFTMGVCMVVSILIALAALFLGNRLTAAPR